MVRKATIMQSPDRRHTSQLIIEKLSKISSELEKEKCLNVNVFLNTDVVEKYLRRIAKSMEGIEKILRKKFDPFNCGRR